MYSTVLRCPVLLKKRKVVAFSGSESVTGFRVLCVLAKNLLIEVKSRPFIAAVRLVRVHGQALCASQAIIRRTGAAALLREGTVGAFFFFLMMISMERHDVVLRSVNVTEISFNFISFI